MLPAGNRYFLLPTAILLFMLPFCCGYLSYAQERVRGTWSGDFGLSVGTNASLAPTSQSSHHIGNATAKMTYATRKAEISFLASGSYDYHYSGVIGMDTNFSGSDTTSVIDISVNELRNLVVGGGMSGSFKPDKYNSFSFSYVYGFDRNFPNYYTISDGVLDPSMILTSSFTVKNTQTDVNSHKANIAYEHIFAKPGRRLNAGINYTNTNSSTYSEWVDGTGDVDFNKPIKLSSETLFVDSTIALKGHYRDTPFEGVNDILINVTYSDEDFCKVENLDVDFSIIANIKGLHDRRSSATFVDGAWKDSVEVRENFLYRTISLNPEVHAKYKIWRFDFDWAISPEGFLRKLDSDGKKGDVSRGEVAQNFSMKNSYKTLHSNKIYLNFNRNESRPSYIQICWFPRQSVQYSNEIYVGNPNLQNTVTNRVSGGYDMAVHDFFELNFALTYTNNTGKVEQTYTNEIYNDREYRVYTWINGGKSDELAADLKLSGSFKNFKTALIGRYNVYHGISLTESETRSGDYSLGAEVEYSLKTWSFNADITYQSDIVRDYNTVKSIAECNARITKKFKRLTLTLDGNNLLDRPIELLTKSEDMTEVRHETTRNNRRIFILGVTWSF